MFYLELRKNNGDASESERMNGLRDVEWRHEPEKPATEHFVLEQH